MVEIKYLIGPENWSSVIDMMELIKNWSTTTYKELEEDGNKYILIQFLEGDVEEAFHIGTLIGHAEKNKEKNKD
jgi:hypothetical protein